MILVKLLPPLARMVGAAEIRVEADGDTIQGLVQRLIGRFPVLAGELGAEAGGEEIHYVIFVNGRDVRALQGMATRVKDRDEVMVLMAMAGG